MSCPEELDLFLLREGGDELPAERARAVADHLAGCTPCQRRLAELQALSQALARPDQLPERDRSAFLAEVIQKVDAHGATGARAPHAPRRRWVFGVAIAAGVASCAVVVLAVGAVFMTVGSDMAPEATMARQAAPASAPAPTVGGAFTPSAQATSDGPAPEAPVALAMDEGRMGRAEERSAMKQSLGASPAAGSGASRPSPRPYGAGSLDDLLDGRVGGDGVRRRASGEEAEQAGIARQQALSPTRMPGQAMGGPSTSWQAPTTGPAAAPPSAIDPNGRFATTYRPGRGSMARFERAMLLGTAPEPVIALVADEGRGHGPLLEPPQDRALALALTPGLTKLPPGGGPVHLAITLRSTTREAATRPKVAVHLVMDVSGSMSGEAIEHARQAALTLVGLLQPSDRFSLVAYSSDARVAVPDGPVGERIGVIMSRIRSLEAAGGTNLEAGLRLGYQQAQASRGQEDQVQLVIVLSDGQPNQGVTDPWSLSEMSAAAFQGEVETTSIGVGDQYEPQVMSAIAEHGAGGYYYLPDASTIEQVLRAELEVRCQPVARAVELRVRLGDGVQLLEAYGSRRLNQAEAARVRQTEVAIDNAEAHRTGINVDRQEDREGGMRFFIPGFARDDEHTILLRLRAPAGAAGVDLALASVELRYKDRVLGANGGDERQVRAGYATSAIESEASQDLSVRRAVYAFRTGQELVNISALLAQGAQQEALQALWERVEVLRSAGERLGDGALRADAERLDGMRQAVLSRSMGNDLMTGSMLQRAGNGFMR